MPPSRIGCSATGKYVGLTSWGRDRRITIAALTRGRSASRSHLVANHLVSIDGDEATCTAAFQATHLLANPHGGPLWTLGGHYDLRLARSGEGWRITSVCMIADWATGNQQIMALASQRS